MQVVCLFSSGSMCYNIAIYRTKEELEKRFDASFEKTEQYQPFYHVSSFSLPEVPVITNKNPDSIQLFTWGLIPFWVKSREDAEALRVRTMNARGETIYEKPSFRNAAKKQHCLVLVNGFYEWRSFQGKNYPYYISLQDEELFALAGLWEGWQDPVSEELIYSFSVVTTEANPLMAQVHNKKKRMPVILPRPLERMWIDNEVTFDQMKELLVPFEEAKMQVYTISRLITARDKDSNVPEVLQEYQYTELPPLDSQQALF